MFMNSLLFYICPSRQLFSDYYQRSAPLGMSCANHLNGTCLASSQTYPRAYGEYQVNLLLTITAFSKVLRGPFLTSPLGANFDPMGEVIPGGVKFSVRPSILLNSRECSPLGVS
jgi:hypothetical protein